MDQEKINRILRWFEKGIRWFVGITLVLHIGTLLFAGGWLWYYAPETTSELVTYQLSFGLAWNGIKMLVMGWVVFGRWSLSYTKKKSDVDPNWGKDW